MADDTERFRRRYERERSARLQAEKIAEDAIAALSASNRELDARVQERTVELEAALERASQADQVKSDAKQKGEDLKDKSTDAANKIIGSAKDD